MPEIPLTAEPRTDILDLLEEPVRVLRNVTDAPTAFLRFAALCTLAVCISPWARFRWGSNWIHTNVFALTIAPPGILRKAEGVRLLRRSVAKAMPEGFLLPGAGSNEALVDVLADQRAGVMVYDEAASVFARSKLKYAQETPQLLCGLYDGATQRVKTKRADHTISNPIVGLVGATAPDPLKKFLSTGDAASGLLSRFLFCFAKESDAEYLPIPPAMDERALDNYLGELESVVTAPSPDFEFGLSEDGRETFIEIDEAIRKEFPEPELSSFVVRGLIYVAKLAAVTAYGRRRSQRIEPGDLLEAAGYVRESLAFARTLVSDLEDKENENWTVRNAKRMREKLAALEAKEEYSHGLIPSGELMRVAKLDRDEFWAAGEYNVEIGELVFVPGKNRGCYWGRRSSHPEVEATREAIESSLEVLREHHNRLKYPHRNGRTK